MIDSVEAALGIYAASLAVGVLSGLVPIVNGELYLIGVVLLTGNVWAALALAVLVGLGQMIAKVILYQAARGATNAGNKDGKIARKIEKARAKIDKWKDKPLMVTFISAVTGLPPFYLITLLAGVLEVRFRTFLILGIIGRTIRFVAIALIALLF
jgi:membrane protein YqaA with SNARE-associated domain